MKTFVNPVHERPCPDPFVLKHLGIYWAFCTGIRPDGRAFGILRSTDLVRWEEIGSAMDPLPADAPGSPGEHTCYWAPETMYDAGRFYMYYSVGNEQRMQVRVAVAERPEGPYVDAGVRLTDEEFAIDAHVFEDDDGARWLFYATDFLSHTHVGTGTACDRLLDPLTTERRPRAVTRARFDWQVYDPARAEKGGVRWHTVEGPFVLKRRGRYYQMFSAGNWKNVTYGVSYATTEDLSGNAEWTQHCDGEQVLPLLRTIPGRAVGPGHNSVVRGPDNARLWCVYHRWSPLIDDRVLCIDRLDWVGDELTVWGPSVEPEIAPDPAPSHVEWGARFHAGPGRWEYDKRNVRQSLQAGAASARWSLAIPAARIELAPRVLAASSDGTVGLALADGERTLWRLALVPARGEAVVSWRDRAGGSRTLAAGRLRGWVPEAHALVRVVVDGTRVTVTVDHARFAWTGEIGGLADALVLETDGAAAEFAALEVTPGWEDLFEDAVPAAAAGWTEALPGAWSTRRGALVGVAEHDPAEIGKPWPLGAYEVAIDVQAQGDAARYAGVGLRPAAGPAGPGPLVLLAREGEETVLIVENDGETHTVPLPPDCDPVRTQPLRVRKSAGLLRVQRGPRRLAEIPAPDGPTWPRLHVRRGRAVFDMVRVTGLAEPFRGESAGR